MENINIKKAFFSLFIPIMLFSFENNFDYTQNKESIIQSSTDSDLDGVPDRIDQCPDTPFLDTVKANGCSKKQTPLSTSYISVSTGFSYTKDIDKFSYAYTNKHNHNGNHHHGENHNDHHKQKKVIENRYKEIYVPFSIYYSKEKWIYSITTGYLYTNDNGKISKSLSDTYLSAGYITDFFDENYPVVIFKAKMKVATSKESEKNDYTMEIGIYKTLSANQYIYMDIGYTVIGMHKNYFDIDYAKEINKITVGVSYSFYHYNFTKSNVQNITVYNSFYIDDKIKLYLGYTRDFFNSRDYNNFSFSISKSF